MNVLLKQMVQSIFCEAEERHLHQTSIHSRIDNDIFGSDRWDIMSEDEKIYLRGYIDALFDSFWKNVVYVYPWKGALYERARDMPREGYEWHREHSGLTGFHVYRDAMESNYTGDPTNYKIGLEVTS